MAIRLLCCKQKLREEGSPYKLGIENEEDTELADLEMETRPEDVLAEIDRLQQRMK
jgi:hypothetical protein